MTSTITVRYFAAFREAVGIDQIDYDIPVTIQTASALIDWVALQYPDCAAIFGNRTRVHIAINNRLMTLDARIKASDVIDIFPPVSGG